MRNLLIYIGCLLSYVYPYSLHMKLKSIMAIVYTGWINKCFRHFGLKSKFGLNARICGCEFIEVGDNVYIGNNIALTAFCINGTHETLIKIGNNCMFGDNNHVTACSGIRIGRNLRTGKDVLISDNSHGDPHNPEHLKLHPNDRPLTSKGPIIIGDNVWIGEKASIMGGVTIADGVIIGANTVVTHDITQEGAIVVGCPGHIINQNNIIR